jgi:LysM repeat protein
MFVTSAHRCFHAGRAKRIAPAHQAEFCLGPASDSCPVVTGALKKPPGAWPHRRVRTRWLLGAVAALGLIGAAVWAATRPGPASAPGVAPSLSGLAAPVEASATPALPDSTPVATATAPAPSATPMPTPEPTATPAPSPTPAPTAAPAVQRRYRVQAGDNATTIAATFGVSLQDLMSVNRLPPDGRIFVDQELIIP